MARRPFLTNAASAAAAIALGCRPVGPDSPPITSSLAALPDPASSGIEHAGVFVMADRSFDHFLGWLANAHRRQAGLTCLDAADVPRQAFPRAPALHGCGHERP